MNIPPECVFLLCVFKVGVWAVTKPGQNCTEEPRNCCNITGQNNEAVFRAENCGNNISNIEENTSQTSGKMLGAIIGGMIGSLTGAMLAHTLIRMIAKKCRKRGEDLEANSDEVEENEPPYTIQVSDAVEASRATAQPQSCILPPYESIHLYKKSSESANYESTEMDCNCNKVEDDEMCGEEVAPPPLYTHSQSFDSKFRAATNIDTSYEISDDHNRPTTLDSTASDNFAFESNESATESNITTVLRLAKNLGIHGSPDEVLSKMKTVLSSLETDNTES